jgi:hypothetical protein
MLTDLYAARLAPYLAVRLLKEPWPPWKVLASLLYLKRHQVPGVAPALARYSLTAALPQARDLALEALQTTVGDQAARSLIDEAKQGLREEEAAPPPKF